MYREIFDEKKSFKILIQTQYGKWIDVSKKKAVIYGAGQGCFDLMNEIQLPNVCMVVDSDKNKWNREIQLLNITYKVKCPYVLSTLDSENYYIIVSSNKYEKSIKESINKFIEGRKILICNKEKIYYCYRRIEDMFCNDPVLISRIIKLNLSFRKNYIISLFEKTSKCIENVKIERFMPVKDGESKLVFFFGSEKELWVFGIPGLHNEFEEIAINRDRQQNKNVRCALKARLNINKEITVFENEEVIIQKYAGEYIDFFSDDIKKKVLKKCGKLHQIEEGIDIKNDMIPRYTFNLVEKVRKGGNSSIKEIRMVEQGMEKPLKILKKIEFIPKLCHCDLTCSNVVCFDNELFFIDWEYMAMSDPMFDVCGYLFSVGMAFYEKEEVAYEKVLLQVYTSLKDDLAIYFGRRCTVKEYLHALLVMLVYEYRNILRESLHKKYIDVKKADILLERIKHCGFGLEV